MRFAVLSSGDTWHLNDIQRAAATLDHKIVPVSFRRLKVLLNDDSARILGPEITLNEVNGIIVRTVPAGSLEQIVFRMDVLHQLVDLGIPVVNGPRAIEGCVDKFLASARLRSAGLPVPKTFVCERADDAMEAFVHLGGDVVVKPLFGSLGRGMVRVDQEEMAYRTFTTLDRLDSVIYIQEFIQHPGWDLRAFVLDGEVVAAMKRSSRNDWRNNIARGADGEMFDLNAEEEEAAIRAATALQADICGVDLLPGPDGTRYVIEANSVPGWSKISQVTGVDIAEQLLRFMESKR